MNSERLEILKVVTKEILSKTKLNDFVSHGFNCTDDNEIKLISKVINMITEDLYQEHIK